METSDTDQLAQLLGELRAEVHAARQETNALKRELIISKERTDDLARQLLQSQAGQTPLPASGGNLPSTSSMNPVQINLPGNVHLAPPERFSGDPKRFAVFINQCRLHFLCRPAAFPTDQAKVAFVLSYLSGNAADWSIPLVNQDDPVLHDFQAFQLNMEKLFARHSQGQALDNELLSLRQGNQDLLAYIASFNRLIVETQWPEDKRITLFYRGLRGELKDVLAQVVNPPQDCSDYIDLVVQIDHRLQNRKADRSKFDARVFSKPPTPSKGVDSGEPMQIGGLKGPLTQKERERRKQLQLCLYCGNSGHFLRDCPVKPAKKAVGAAVTKVTNSEQGNDLARQE